jgi:hypothetical protein
MKSCSALGPNFRVILLVSSLEMGFSMYHASCLISLFTMLSFFLLLSLSGSIEKGNSGFPNFSLRVFLLKEKLDESIESSTICSELLRFPTLRVDPKSFPGKKVL